MFVKQEKKKRMAVEQPSTDELPLRDSVSLPALQDFAKKGTIVPAAELFAVSFHPLLTYR